MTVGELLDRMDSQELSEWMAFDRIDQPESWQQTAQLCFVMDSLWSKKPRKFESFLPRKIKAKAGPISPAALRARLAQFRNPGK